MTYQNSLVKIMSDSLFKIRFVICVCKSRSLYKI